MEVRTELFGEKAAKAGQRISERFDEGFADFLNEQVFGGLWGRPGLPTKTRSLITMAALSHWDAARIADCICAARSISGLRRRKSRR